MNSETIEFGSVCSGIEAASTAWEPMGWRAAWFSEIEPFPCALLAHRWPAVPNLGDMTRIPGLIRAGAIKAPAVFTGGTPCQAFSTAGNRQSLADARGNLSLTFCEIANAVDDIRSDRGQKPCVIMWENVPGVLTTDDNAFGCFLAGLAGADQPVLPGPQPEQGRASFHWKWKKDTRCHVPKWTGAGCIVGPRRTVAWRVINAQYFGVAQRRHRVFVVASARSGFDPARVLFEFESGRRDFAPGFQPEKETAGSAGTGAAGNCGRVAGCWWDGGQTSQTLDAVLHKGQAMPEKNRFPAVLQPVSQYGAAAGCLTARHDSSPCADRGQNVIAVHGTQDPIVSTEGAHCLGRNGGQENAVFQPGWRVRRLMPVEAERLQGFPDNHTLIPDWYQCGCGSAFPESLGKNACPNCGGKHPAKLKKATDSVRYKAIGNSWAVPCAEWIGRRINEQLTGSKHDSEHDR